MKKDKDNFLDGMSFSTSYQINYTNWTSPQIYYQLTVGDEMQKLANIDKQVAAMDSYPDAEKLIASIVK